ncbi:hypothetical protein V525_23095 [Gordonia alkanivorans CGMCC 6845]|uniref:Uncharacterized protein n=1 Tax=Gordonia alkanivorans CGMCC 6845 TaxID=1423140 RepID=W9D637_9ACTN|nr:hypothetical protein V525_23095 [Gordonia alkanivorans CGMCC 6845]
MILQVCDPVSSGKYFILFHFEEHATCGSNDTAVVFHRGS